MTTITIPQYAFKAVSLAMAVRDIRYYLNGMLIEHNGAETRLVATDGHRLNAAIIEHPGALVTAMDPIILPAKMVETICKAKAPRGQKDIAEVTISFDAQEGGKASALLPDGSETVAVLVDGKYPDYRRVIPNQFSGEVTDYNPDYVADANAAMLEWFRLGRGKSHGYSFGYNGSNAGGYSAPGFVAIVMPTRTACGAFVDPRFSAAMAAPEVLAQVEAA